MVSGTNCVILSFGDGYSVNTDVLCGSRCVYLTEQLSTCCEREVNSPLCHLEANSDLLLLSLNVQIMTNRRNLRDFILIYFANTVQSPRVRRCVRRTFRQKIQSISCCIMLFALRFVLQFNDISLSTRICRNTATVLLFVDATTVEGQGTKRRWQGVVRRGLR